MVEVTSSVWRQWQESAEIGLLINPLLTQELIESIIDDLDLGYDNGLLVAEMWVQRSAKGPGIWLANCAPEDHREALRRLADALEQAGLPDATITSLPITRPLGGKLRGFALIKVFIALRGTRPPDWTGELGWPMDRLDWQMSAEDRDAAVDFVLDWALALPGAKPNVAVAPGMYFTPVPLDAVPATRQIDALSVVWMLSQGLSPLPSVRRDW